MAIYRGPAPLSTQPTWPAGTFMAALGSDSRGEILSLGRLREFALGTRLLTEGDPTNHVILMLDGLVKVSADSVDGQCSLLSVRVRGDVVGELAGVEKRPRLATVTAAGLVRARILNWDSFQGFISCHSDAALALAASVSAKLRWSTQRRIDFGSYPVPVRLARVMIELARSHGHRTDRGFSIGVALAQPELAALIGASEPAVHRTLAELRRDGIINTGYRQTIILQPDALREAAGPDVEPLR